MALPTTAGDTNIPLSWRAVFNPLTVQRVGLLGAHVAIGWEKLIVIFRTRWRIQVSAVYKVGLEILGTLQDTVGTGIGVVGVDDVVITEGSRFQRAHSNRRWRS